jgi:hypothetical protein
LAAVRAYQTAQGLTAANQVGPMTRAKLNAQIAGTTGGSQGGQVVLPTGPVSATLSFDNPAAGALIGGQAAANLMHVNFTGTGTVTSVTLTKSGISDTQVPSAVYLYDGNTRLTSAYTFNSNNTLTMNGLAIAVSGSKVISVRADIPATVTCSGSITALTVCESTVAVAVTGFIANGTAVTSNVAGNMMTLASGTLATVNLTTGSNTVSPANTTITAGAVNQTLWSRTVNVSPRAVTLYGVTVKMVGSAPANTLANAGLYVDGTQVATAAINANNQYILSPSAPFTLTTGNHLLEVRGDVVAGSSRSFYLSLEQGSDISVKDTQMGAMIAPTASAGTTTNVNSGTITINGATGGSVTVTQDSTFNTTTTIVGGATNVTMASFKFSAYGEDEKVMSLSFTPTIVNGGSGTATLRNVGLYVNGAQVGSNQTATHNTPLNFNSLGSNLIIPAGSSAIVSIKGDAVTSAGIDYTTGSVQFTLGAGSSNIQGVSSSQFTANASQAGQSLTISSASSVNSFAGTTGYAVSTPAPGTTAKIGSWTLQTGSAEGATLKSIAVTLAGTAVSGNQFTNLTVKQGSTVLGVAIGLPVVGANNFSVNIPVAINSGITLDVYGDFGSGANTLTVTPSMGITYQGQVTGLSTTVSAVAGSQTTCGAASIIAANATTSTALAAQFVTGNGSSPLAIATFNIKTNNSVGGAVLKDMTFTTVSSSIQSITVNGITKGVNSNTVTVNNVNITVPSDPSGVNIPVTAQLVCIGSGCSGVSNSNVKLTLTGLTYYDGTTTQTVSSITTAASNTLKLVSTVPTVSLTTSVGSGLSNSNIEVGRFTVTAGSTGDLKLEAMPITISISGAATITAGTVCLYDASGNTLSNAPAACLNGSGTFTWSTPFSITRGTSQTFTVYATFTGVTGATNTMSETFSLGAKASLLWTDVTGGVSSIPGTNIYGYPSGTQTKNN